MGWRPYPGQAEYVPVQGVYVMGDPEIMDGDTYVLGGSTGFLYYDDHAHLADWAVTSHVDLPLPNSLTFDFMGNRPGTEEIWVSMKGGVAIHNVLEATDQVFLPLVTK